VAGEVGEHSHSFDLDLLILGGQDVQLDGVEDGDPDVIGEQLGLGHIVEEHIGDARYRIQHELLILLDCSFVDGLHEVSGELLSVDLNGSQLFRCMVFLGAEVCNEFEDLGEGLLDTASTEILVLFVFLLLSPLLLGTSHCVEILVDIELG
jgi:hypothetical protein